MSIIFQSCPTDTRGQKNAAKTNLAAVSLVQDKPIPAGVHRQHPAAHSRRTHFRCPSGSRNFRWWPYCRPGRRNAVLGRRTPRVPCKRRPVGPHIPGFRYRSQSTGSVRRRRTVAGGHTDGAAAAAVAARGSHGNRKQVCLSTSSR